jgi:hypothetical protein
MAIRALLTLLFISLSWTVSVGTARAQGPLTNGQNHVGTIATPGQLHEWTFTAAQGDYITVSIAEVFLGETDPGFNPWIRLRGPNAAELASDQGTLAAQVNLPAPLSGTYTVVVGSFTVAATGAYRLTLARTPGEFVVPPGDEGGPLTNGANHPGVVPRGDVDLWTFTAAQGDYITASIGEVFPGETDPGFNPWIRLRGPNGSQLVSDQGTLAAQVNQVAPLSGTYTVVVSSFTLNAETGNYLLRLAHTPAPFVVPPGDQGGALENGANHLGVIARGDLDIWSFTAGQGDAISVSIAEFLPTEVDPGFNPWIRLRGPNGAQLAADQGTLAASINVTAPLSGTYTVVVGSFTIQAPTGDYTLRLARTPGTFVVPPGDQGGPIANAVAQQGTIPLGDLDLWTFSAAQGAALSVSIGEIVVGEVDPGFNPWIRLRGPTGTQLGADQGTTAGQINVVAPVTGLYTVVVASFTANLDPGTYQLTVTGASTPPPPPTGVNDAYAANAGATLVVPPPGVLANDTGAGPLSAVLVSTTSQGALAFNAGGGFSYTPAPGFTGADTFTYQPVGAGGPGTTATVTITVSVATTALPPTGLHVHTIAGNVVTLRWTPPAAGLPPTGYVLEGGVAPGQVLASVPTGSTAPLFTFTAPNGSFFVRMHTVAGASRSGPSNEIRLFVNVAVAPSAPTHLLGLANGSALTLAWRNTYEGGAPTAVRLDVSGAVNLSVPLGITESFTFGGVPPGTYTFVVRTVNAAGASAPSAPVTLTFPSACQGAPLPPANYLATRTGNTIRLLWDPADSGPAPALFQLDVTGAVTATVPIAARSLAAAVPPGSYNIAVRAVNACGASAPTAVQTVVVP